MKRKAQFLTGGALGPMTAIEAARGRYMRAPDHPGGDGGGAGGGGGASGGGVAGLLDDDPPGDGGTPTPSPAPSPSGDGGGGAGGGGAGDPPDMAWASGISADKADGEELSDREWLEKRGYKDFGKVVADARGLERSLRESGKVKIPTAESKPEEVKAFREAIGVPETAEGYEVKLPEVEGGDFKLELDTDFLDPMRKIAHEHNVPAAAFQAMADQMVQQQLEDMKSEGVRADQEVAAVLKDWGKDAERKKMDFRRGAEILGLDKQAIAALQRGDGNSAILMNALAKAGQLAGEDFFAGDGGSQKFGVTSLEEAQAELDRMNSDKDVYAKLKAKDATTTAKYNRLIEAVAHFKERNSKRT